MAVAFIYIERDIIISCDDERRDLEQNATNFCTNLRDTDLRENATRTPRRKSDARDVQFSIAELDVDVLRGIVRSSQIIVFGYF